MKYSTLWATIKSIVVHLPGIAYYNKTMPFLFFFFLKKMNLSNMNIYYGFALLHRLYIFIVTRKDIDKSTRQLHIMSNIFYMQLYLQCPVS